MGIFFKIFGCGCEEKLDEIQNLVSLVGINNVELGKKVMARLEDLVTDMDQVEAGVSELVTLYTDLKSTIGNPTPEQQGLIDKADETAQRVKSALDAVKTPAPTDGGGQVAGGFARRSSGR